MIYDCTPATAPPGPRHQSGTALQPPPGQQRPEQRPASLALPTLYVSSSRISIEGAAEGSALSLDDVLGPARVLALEPGDVDEAGRITSRVLNRQGDVLPPRILFKTARITRTAPVSYTEELVEHLAASGIFLAGLDVSPVAAGTTAADEGKRLLSAHGILSLEGLYLDHVPEGDYVLIALPVGVPKEDDSNPVRAVLKSIV